MINMLSLTDPHLYPGVPDPKVDASTTWNLLAILTSEARAAYMAEPNFYSRFKIGKQLDFEARLKNPRSNPSVADLFERVKRRCEHLL